MRGRIDRRYSEERAEAVPWADAQARLATAEVAWIVTVRPDGRPHATPMVPVVDAGRVWFHTGSTEVKHANIQANPHVLVLAGDTAWEGGLDVAVEGTAVPVTDEAELRRVAALYRGRWDGRWQLEIRDGAVAALTPDTRLVVFEVTPDKAYAHAKGEPFGQTTYRQEGTS
ncbi:pyridoxamine 5'-phosphate oxidase family protein [Asanoa sp. WMMD1127]|uniref:pyridoxamine 5'-phosphate oxidase family protein n=1 Tax=Asanoa sp. WMMD1127 TaxID=3016107 RepID=UPI0024173EB1|nr:pyridoxamine 5'-phosphate oxidase family protein [Asanoa sp. WMMD1127]MDG4825456.1 pyridoxamine 5'-phosphate oxidase family protein [Asanoa sp. WMMD1127]